jgi:serine/threonine-protein kinase
MSRAAAQPGSPSREIEAEPASTAMLPAVGATCLVCTKANHPGVTRCVFCGAALAGGAAGVGALVGLAEPAATLPLPAHTLAAANSDASGHPTSDGRPRSAERAIGAGSASSTGAHVLARGGSGQSPFTWSGDDSDDLIGAPVADPLIGVVVAERYRIVEPLGRGGMGIVYKVEHARIGKLLAMKLLTGELSRNRDVVRRFKQEALTASKLSSPNTVQVFDFGVSEGLTYLVMELVSGEDLGRTLRTLGPMPWSRLGKIVVQVCSSLAEAHHNGIVHRDVKPENIMLVRAPDGSDIAKVLDFGLAKLREGADLNDVTSQGAIVGTPYFMSPEQIRGEGVDFRTDVYALGALMYRGLTGHYPFNGPTPMAVFTKHLTETPTPPIERAPERGIPPGVSAIVLKALEKNPGDRFQTVEDLRAALVEELRALGTSSVESLLDSGQLRRLSRVAGDVDAKAATAAAEVATRDEVERYERKLRRMRWGSFGALAIVAAGLTLAGVKGARLLREERAALDRGHEIEPNDTAAQATAFPFGTTITGQIGKRRDSTHGDRDFYAVDVPATMPGQRSVVKLSVSALPNFATCTLVYRQGLDSPLAQYCVGRPARELVVPALRVDPGRYFIAELQDMDAYGGAPPFIHENVSDSYALSIGASASTGGEEIEPNDQVASANPIVPGAPLTATLAWVRDVDVFCVAPGVGPIRWSVKDPARDLGVVLEVTPMAGTLEGAPVRVHAPGGKFVAPDVQSPWSSAVLKPDGDTPRCLRVRAVTNPWSGANAVVVPTGSTDPYTVEAESAP